LSEESWLEIVERNREVNAGDDDDDVGSFVPNVFFYGC